MNEQEDRQEVNLRLQTGINEYLDGEWESGMIEKYVRKLKNGNATGRDGILNELLKEGSRGVSD